MEKLKRRNNSNAEVYVGSIADVSFLLVIFFMVTSVLVTFRGIDLDLGEAPPDPPDEITREDSVDVHVLGPGRVEVDGRLMPVGGILGYLKPILEQNPDKPVIVRTEPDAPYYSMMTVLDELRQAPEKAGFEVENMVLPTRREMGRDWALAGWSG